MAQKLSGSVNMHGRLIEEINRLKFDTRVCDWYLTHGKMSEKEYSEYLKSLPDSADNVMPADEEDHIENGAASGSETLN